MNIWAVLAILYPILVVLILPNPAKCFAERNQLKGEFDVKNVPIDFTKREQFVWNGSYVLISFGLSVPIGILQSWFFGQTMVSDALFSYRVSDMNIYSAIPALLVGLIVGAVVMYYLAQRLHGNTFDAFLDKRLQGITLRNQYNWLRFMSYSIGLMLICLNFMFFNTYIMVKSSEITYKSFTGIKANTMPISQISSAVIYSHRKAPNGNITNKKWLEIYFLDGSKLDSFYLIEACQIDSLIKAIEKAKGQMLTVLHEDGLPK